MRCNIGFKQHEMPIFHENKSRKNVIITDLDASDGESATERRAQPVKQQHKRQTEKRLQTFGANFPRRSRSADCRAFNVEEEGAVPKSNKAYLNGLLQSKDKQLEIVLQRVSSLHKFNSQFAEENKELQANVEQLQKQVTSLKHQLRHCSNCRQLQSELQQRAEEKAGLQHDLDMMKTLVYRLNVQIERYQDKQRLASNANANANNTTNNVHIPHATPPNKHLTQAQVHNEEGEGDHNSATPQWQFAVHTHTLSPLLRAYDEMLKDKQELIDQFKRDFDYFSAELKNTLEENRRLLDQNAQLQRESNNWQEERARLQTHNDIFRAKADAQTRKSDLAKEKLVEVMRCYEQKMQTLMLDLEHLQGAYTRCKTELATLKSLQAQSPDGIRRSLDECKQLLAELSDQHKQEKANLEHTIAELREQREALEQKYQQYKAENSSLNRRLHTRDESVEEVNNELSTLRRELDRTKRSRDRLKARLRIALQWARKLEEGQLNVQNTYDALKRLEMVVQHKESQVRGLHQRHFAEVEKLKAKLLQKEETIRRILKGKLTAKLKYGEAKDERE